MSNRPADLPGPTAPDETLADAVCCDAFFAPYAEPQQTYELPDVDLYAKMDPNGRTTFYDSVCGIPLFITPINRTFADFQADTDEHGWPSFRAAEVVQGNVIWDKVTTDVKSKCGTHLGSYLPDEQGERWCIDLSCVSGNPISPSPGNYIDLVTFDGAKDTSFIWVTTNDPVMGGVSTSTFTIDKKMATGTLNGTVRNVPSLSAPGFCKAATQNVNVIFNDATGAQSIVIEARSSTPDYAGYKLAFSAGLSDGFYAFKANFKLTSDWSKVAIPLNMFSNDWSSYTGDCDTLDPTGKQHYCCSDAHPEKCPQPQDLKRISHMSIWAEGHAADFHIEVRRIGAQ